MSLKLSRIKRFPQVLLETINFYLQPRLLINTTFTFKSNTVKNDEHFFGFQKVSPDDKREKVQSVFSNVASRYDLMNDIMSGGIHRFWKDYLIHTLSPVPGTKLLDAAGGTGDIALRFLRSCSKQHNHHHHMFSEASADEEEHDLKTQVVVLDMNENMLSICKKRAEDDGFGEYLTCIQGNAEVLPLPSSHFDAYTIGFGIRNVVHIEKALSEAKRVLRPGGRFLCLEFSQVRNPVFYRITQWYNHEIIPVIGQIVAGDWKSYQYLAESIQKFPNQEKFSSMIEDAGFKTVSYENLMDGIAAIHSAYNL